MHARWGHRAVLYGGASLLALGMAGFSRPETSAARPPAARTVAIAAFAFAPERVTVSRGDTVVWRNDDIVPHTATAADSSWDSGVVQPGGSWRMVAGDRGEWKYLCALHPSMVGTLVVR